MKISSAYLSAFIITLASFSHLSAAPFDSGSDGSDGALVFEPDQGDIIFDPDDFDPALDADRDGIYNFTTITIGSGTHVQCRADVLGHKPLIWLASGDVVIDGVLQLGANGNVAGVGGFSGGNRNVSRDGQGPGGGAGSTVNSSGERPSLSYINPYLIPLVGASGGGAGNSYDGLAGGGAMLLASSGEIAINGTIFGEGAEEEEGYLGSGNLRLVADTISGEGRLYSFKIFRMEAWRHQYLGETSYYENTQVIKTRPGPIFPTNPIKITLVDDTAVDHTKPGANKGEPDVTINDGSLVTLQVSCVGIPLDATIRVVGWNDTVGKVEAIAGPLTGAVGNSTAICEMVIPTGNTTFMAQAELAP